MIFKSSSVFRLNKLVNIQLSNQILGFQSISKFSQIQKLFRKNSSNCLSTFYSPVMTGLQLKSAFSSSPKLLSSAKHQNQKKGKTHCYLTQVSVSLIDKILQTTKITQERLNTKIQTQVQKQLCFYQKNLMQNSSSQLLLQEQSKTLQQNQLKQKEKGKLNLLLLKKQKQRLQHKLHQQNADYIQNFRKYEEYRAMIMTRLQILWNDKYEDLQIDQLIALVEKLEHRKQLKNNELKIMSMMFLTVEILKKYMKLPRLNKNTLCSTKSLVQNFQHIKLCIKGEFDAKKNWQKVQRILSLLGNSLQKNTNRVCYMKVQNHLHFLIRQIYHSFHDPDQYNDGIACLFSNPPRVVFDQPFHQQYDRFLQMTVLIIFDKRLKKQAKKHKLQQVKHIFQKLKLYQQDKLQQIYSKSQNSLCAIKDRKKKYNKMDKRVELVQLIQNYVMKSQVN